MSTERPLGSSSVMPKGSWSGCLSSPASSLPSLWTSSFRWQRRRRSRRGRSKLFEFAAQTRLPVMYQNGDVVRDGVLIGYSPLFGTHYPRAADYVDKILKGARP